MIKYADLSNQVYEQLKAMILSNQYEPGQKLLQEKIAAQLGVSRTPLHKAFQMLENEFLVESVPRRGIFVKKVDYNQIYDAFECREALEGVAARRLALRHKAQDIDLLKGFFTPFMNPNIDIDVDKYRKADESFHKQIMLLSGNTILGRLEGISNILVRTYQKGLVRPVSETLKEHFEIIDAIASGNGELAADMISKHSRAARENIEQMIQQR